MPGIIYSRNNKHK